MDPITLLAAATAAYNGVKKAVELGREVHDIYGQLSTWAGHVGDLKDAIEGLEKSEATPSIWKKITFDKSETAEAFDLYAAKQKIKEMEEEIFHMFLYGELCHLGIDGYREFKKMRNEVREKRKSMLANQLAARRNVIHNIRNWAIALSVLGAGSILLWVMIQFIVDNIK
jgi:hypothetical protein